MSRLILYTLGSEKQRLVNQTLCYALSLSSELCIGFPPLNWDEATRPSKETTEHASYILRYIINNQEIPDGYIGFTRQTICDVADHLDGYETEELALRVSCIAAIPDQSIVAYIRQLAEDLLSFAE